MPTDSRQPANQQYRHSVGCSCLPVPRARRVVKPGVVRLASDPIMKALLKRAFRPELVLLKA